jgi:hypothetical protein
MGNQIVLKKSSVAAKVPLTGDLTYGEVALNYADGKLYFKTSSNVIDHLGSATSTQTLSNKTLSSPTITGSALFSAIGGDEGGELRLGTAATNSTLAGGSVTVDIWQNNLRIFESGGNNRGVYLNLSTASNGVGSGLVTTDGTQTLTNKTINSATLGGTITIAGVTGTSGQVLMSTGTGISWSTPSAGALSNLSDVVISSPQAQQVLKYNGTQWVNAASDTAVASAVFAPQAMSDLGSVTDSIIGISEDLGTVTQLAYYVYDMGQLRLDGIASLSNIDQSVKADYIGYSIIFGF